MYVLRGAFAKGFKAVKKLALLIVILSCFFVFSPKPTHAASELEIWCLTVGSSWDSVSSTCTIPASSSVSASLTVLQGETINYDPSIGVDQESIESIDFELINAFGLENVDEFMDQFSSPTTTGLIIGIISISAIAIVTLISKNRSK